MSDVTFVSADTAPSLAGALTRSDGTPINLAGASVKFQMRLLASRRFTVDAAAAVVNATAGTVRYDWVAGDLRTPGDYVSRWKITFGDGTIQHSEPENTITVDPQ